MTGAHHDRVRTAVAAAVEVAGAHGIRATEPRVLHDGANVVVHLAPVPLVARVATLTRLPSDDELRPWLELRELHVAAWYVVIARGHPEWAEEAAARLAALRTVG